MGAVLCCVNSKTRKLIFVASPLSMQLQEIRAKTVIPPAAPEFTPVLVGIVLLDL
jgi:hypothetical protein